MTKLRIALIGSRELEKNPIYHPDIPLCYKVAYRLAELGHTFTSGLCELGMDGIAQKAYSQAVLDGKATLDQFEVYVAEQKNITNSTLPNKQVARVRNPKLIRETESLAASVMEPSHWARCNTWARGMHSRNCHQIFGYHLNYPVDAVVTWTPNGNMVGGTRTALLLAQDAGIPIFNLGRPDQDKVLEEIRQFLLDHNVVGVK